MEAAMDQAYGYDLEPIRKCRTALTAAIERERSTKWILRLWGRFIKARDLYRCLCCGSAERIQAHHIVRRTLCPAGAFETGNGITLCHECHQRVHAEFNGRPNMALPLGAEGGDDQDEWAFLFGLLYEDAIKRGLAEDEFYFISDHMLQLFANFQGYKELHRMVMNGEISRIRFAHEIWRSMPEAWYTNFVSELVRLNF